MAPTPTSPTVRSYLVPLFLRAVPAPAARALEQEFGLPPDSASRMPFEVSLRVEQELPDAAAARVGDSVLGLKVAQSMPRGRFGLVEFLGRSTATLGEAIARVLHYLPLLDDTALIALETRGEEA